MDNKKTPHPKRDERFISPAVPPKLVHTPLTSFILNAVNGKYYLETRSHLQLKGEFMMLSDWLAPAANSLIFSSHHYYSLSQFNFLFLIVFTILSKNKHVFKPIFT
jgi:hypothetical protein